MAKMSFNSLTYIVLVGGQLKGRVDALPIDLRKAKMMTFVTNGASLGHDDLGHVSLAEYKPPYFKVSNHQLGPMLLH